MRSLRIALTLAGVAAGMALGSGAAGAAEPANAWFPLAVGNSWTYRCAIDSEFQFEKTLRVVAVEQRDGARTYRAEMRVKGDPKPLVQQLTLAADGSVYNAFGDGGEGRELLITAAPRVGDPVGAWRVGAQVVLDTPARKKLQALRVENFALETPASAERQGEWRGRFYARSIGPVGEADGLGGECLLSRYRVHASPNRQ